MSATNTLELRFFDSDHPKDQSTTGPSSKSLANSKVSSDTSRLVDDAAKDVTSTLPGPATRIVEAQKRWNSSRSNVWRVFVTFLSFIVMGANDAAYGPLIPYLETYYALNYIVVSLVFLSPFVGYVLAALSNNRIHMHLGQRGAAFIGPVCHLLAYIVLAVHPPYPVLVIVYILAGFGNGLLDAAWNAWIGNMANANELLGFLHGFYGLGATISPLIATSMIAKGGLPWYTFYYVMVGAAVFELATSVAAFWSETGQVYQERNPRTTDDTGGRTKEALKSKVTWLCAIFLLGYVGAEVSLGGWIVTFMIRERSGTSYASGLTAVGFWLGITVGRVVLGFITPRIGERLAICIYLLLGMGLELLFWLVPQFIVSAIAVSFVGFFLGPLFPATVIAATKLLPKHLHVSAIGFAAAFGGSGAAIFPFVVGVIAQAKGVQVLQPIILALMAAILGIWLCLPRMPRDVHET